MIVRRGLAVLLSSLLAVPAVASPTKNSPAAASPIGTFSYSDSANVGGAGALAGTTVFSGDLIEVAPHGSAGILLNGGMQVRVSSASRLRLKEITGSKNEVEMEMFTGAAQFRSSETAQVVGRLADATVRANGAKPAAGIISVVNKQRAIIGAEKGELLLSTAHDGKSVALHEGEFVELTLTTEQAPSQEDEKPKRAKPSASTLTRGQVAIIGVVLAGAVIVAGVTLARTTLTNQQKQDLISPFKFP